MSEATKQAGWSWLVNSTRWHFFRDGRSLCARWMYFGEPNETDDKESPDNCATCWKKRQRELAAVGEGAQDAT